MTPLAFIAAHTDHINWHRRRAGLGPHTGGDGNAAMTIIISPAVVE